MNSNKKRYGSAARSVVSSNTPSVSQFGTARNKYSRNKYSRSISNFRAT